MTSLLSHLDLEHIYDALHDKEVKYTNICHFLNAGASSLSAANYIGQYLRGATANDYSARR